MQKDDEIKSAVATGDTPSNLKEKVKSLIGLSLGDLLLQLGGRIVFFIRNCPFDKIDEVMKEKDEVAEVGFEVLSHMKVEGDKKKWFILGMAEKSKAKNGGFGFFLGREKAAGQVLAGHNGLEIWESKESFHFGLNKKEGSQKLEELLNDNPMDLEHKVLKNCLINVFQESTAKLILGMPMSGNCGISKGTGLQFMNDGSQSDPPVKSKVETDCFQIAHACERVRVGDEVFTLCDDTKEMSKPLPTFELDLEEVAGWEEDDIEGMEDEELRVNLTTLKSTQDGWGLTDAKALGGVLIMLEQELRDRGKGKTPTRATSEAASAQSAKTEKTSNKKGKSNKKDTESEEGPDLVGYASDNEGNRFEFVLEPEHKMAKIASHVFTKLDVDRTEWMELAVGPGDGEPVDLRARVKNILPPRKKGVAQKVELRFTCVTGDVTKRSIKSDSGLVCVGVKEEVGGVKKDKFSIWVLVSEDVTIQEMAVAFSKIWENQALDGKTHLLVNEQKGKNLVTEKKKTVNQKSSLKSVIKSGPRFVQLLVPIKSKEQREEQVESLGPSEFDD